MKIEYEFNNPDDYIKLIPENEHDSKELSRLKPPYKEILSGAFIDGSIGFLLKK